MLIKINHHDWENSLKLVKCSPLIFKHRSLCKNLCSTEHLWFMQARRILLWNGNKSPETQNFHVPNTWKNPFGALSGCQPVVLATAKLQVHSDLCDGFVRTLETCKARMCSFNSLVGMHELDSIGVCWMQFEFINWYFVWKDLAGSQNYVEERTQILITLRGSLLIKVICALSLFFIWLQYSSHSMLEINLPC